MRIYCRKGIYSLNHNGLFVLEEAVKLIAQLAGCVKIGKLDV